MTLLPFVLPASLAAPPQLSYANGWAIVSGNSLEFLSTKEKRRWKERGQRQTDRRAETERDRVQTMVTDQRRRGAEGCFYFSLNTLLILWHILIY